MMNDWADPHANREQRCPPPLHLNSFTVDNLGGDGGPPGALRAYGDRERDTWLGTLPARVKRGRYRPAPCPDVAEHFKVLADLEDDIDRTPVTEAVHARMIAALARRDGLRPIDRAGTALMIEHAARLADHANKLTLVVDRIDDVLAEADFYAGKAARTVVSRLDVETAIAQRIRRSSRLRDRAQEDILQDLALIDTSGMRIGQVNGLSVVELAGFRFGRPTRITCRVRPGSGKLVDIEREVALGGPIHSKGVLILSGFLAGRYALDTPMSLFASLVFEQSYGGVEGDSAPSAVLYAD